MHVFKKNHFDNKFQFISNFLSIKRHVVKKIILILHFKFTSNFLNIKTHVVKNHFYTGK